MSTILIVDDEVIDREHAERCLRKISDVRLLFAEDGKAALELISSDCPDLVLTDLWMPEMNGLELVETLQEEYPLLPVILMTSRGNEQIAVKALKAGADSYVPKNVLKQELVNTVRQDSQS